MDNIAYRLTFKDSSNHQQPCRVQLSYLQSPIFSLAQSSLFRCGVQSPAPGGDADRAYGGVARTKIPSRDSTAFLAKSRVRWQGTLPRCMIRG